MILVEFTIQAAMFLDSSFKPLDSWSERVTENVSDEQNIVSFHYGEEPTIVNIIYRKVCESNSRSYREDDVIVTCQGLPDSMRVQLRMARLNTDSRFIEIDVAGPEKSVNPILEGFERRFNTDHIPREREIEYTLQSARAAAQIHAWRTVELNAKKVLDNEPYNSEATMFLGLVKAAQGYEPESESLLLASLILNPSNFDAYYNLGRIVLDQGRCILASEAFKKGLTIEPTYHPLHYQLGRALERLGDLKGALEAYQEALIHSPASEQIFGHLIEDFSIATTESIARVNQAIRMHQTNTEEQCSE
ncbi:MAG: tetratricopeptide repeat protein [Candidatus Thorarchaeota archaeon]